MQEFRRPEFEVTARNETTGPYFVDDHAIVAVEAKYFSRRAAPQRRGHLAGQLFAGQLLAAQLARLYLWPLDAVVVRLPAVLPEEAYGPGWPPYEEVEVETFTGLTDASGNHYLRLDFERADEPQPVSVLAEATVMDVNRQAWAGTTTLLVHPAELYVGLRSERTFVQRGVPLEIELIVTDLDGVAVPGRAIEVRAARLEWKHRQGAWREEAVDVQDCSVQSALEPVSCTFETPVGGKYQITATVTDDAGRRNQSQFTRWVSGGQRPPAREVELEQVTLIPDKETYAPGDVAQVLVQAPFSPAEGLLTVARSGILYTERFSVVEDTVTLHVPIDEGHIPNLHLQVELVGAAPRTDDRGERPRERAPPPRLRVGRALPGRAAAAAHAGA